LLKISNTAVLRVQTDPRLTFEEKVKLIDKAFEKDDALDYAKEAEKIALETKDKLKIQDVRNMLMRLYSEKGKLYGNHAVEMALSFGEFISDIQKAELIRQGTIAATSAKTALKYCDRREDREIIREDLQKYKQNLEKFRKIKTY